MSASGGTSSSDGDGDGAATSDPSARTVPATAAPPAPRARLEAEEEAEAEEAGGDERPGVLRGAKLDHVALACAGDPETLLSFYTRTLGFGLCANVAAFRRGAFPFPSARVNDATILDFFPPALAGPGPALAPASHLCFAVPRAELDALRARLDAAGVAYDVPAGKRSGARGDASTLYLDDPEGNTLEFRYYDNDAEE